MRSDPDRPLLRVLNRSAGNPVLAMCGLPGKHDPAHAAAGRLPVRFHKYSDVRLYWREFSGSGFSGAGNWRPEWQQRFVALIVLTNAGQPIVDERSVSAIMDFRDYRKPVLWGEVTPEGAVMWRPEFYIARICTGKIDVLNVETLEKIGTTDAHRVGHYQLVEEPA